MTLTWAGGRLEKTARFCFPSLLQGWMVAESTGARSELKGWAQAECGSWIKVRTPPLQLPARLETLPRQQVWSWFPAGALGPPITPGVLGQGRFAVPRMLQSCLFLLFSSFTINLPRKSNKTSKTIPIRWITLFATGKLAQSEGLWGWWEPQACSLPLAGIKMQNFPEGVLRSLFSLSLFWGPSSWMLHWVSLRAQSCLEGI